MFRQETEQHRQIGEGEDSRVYITESWLGGPKVTKVYNEQNSQVSKERLKNYQRLIERTSQILKKIKEVGEIRYGWEKIEALAGVSLKLNPIEKVTLAKGDNGEMRPATICPLVPGLKLSRYLGTAEDSQLLPELSLKLNRTTSQRVEYELGLISKWLDYQVMHGKLPGTGIWILPMNVKPRLVGGKIELVVTDLCRSVTKAYCP